MRNQLVLSFLFKRTPGASRTIFDNIDILNLPNPVQNIQEKVITQDIHVKNKYFRF